MIKFKRESLDNYPNFEFLTKENSHFTFSDENREGVALALKLLHSDDFCSKAYSGLCFKSNEKITEVKVKEIIEKIRSEGCVMKILNNDIHIMSIETTPSHELTGSKPTIGFSVKYCEHLPDTTPEDKIAQCFLTFAKVLRMFALLIFFDLNKEIPGDLVQEGNEFERIIFGGRIAPTYLQQFQENAFSVPLMYQVQRNVELPLGTGNCFIYNLSSEYQKKVIDAVRTWVQSSRDFDVNILKPTSHDLQSTDFLYSSPKSVSSLKKCKRKRGKSSLFFAADFCDNDPGDEHDNEEVSYSDEDEANEMAVRIPLSHYKEMLKGKRF
jgi:hypothetical protein